ncbi:hypothetical protein AVEN_247233-1 [Araneus ventricosus]|uniref:Uncharacterized protein n=1 Tax=Araneus ventricosus TaxID=182803 RepID=A0A4Y2EUE5_ARAVE|nr:hypothetical protein AVEN_247233-1 [Araneus ventricosus]
MKVMNRKSNLMLKQSGFYSFPPKSTLHDVSQKAHPGIVTRSFIFFRPGATASISAFKVFVGSALQYSPVSSQLYIWSAVNFSLTIKSFNSAIKLFPASISDDSFSPAMLS